MNNKKETELVQFVLKNTKSNCPDLKNLTVTFCFYTIPARITPTIYFLLYLNNPASGILYPAKLNPGNRIIKLLAVLTDRAVLNLHHAVF